MARKKKQDEQPSPQAGKPKQHEALEALKAVFDVIPKGKFGDVLAAASLMENYLRRGLRGLDLLDGIRRYILDSPDLGGEESPFVKEIDKLVPRDDAKSS